MPTKLKDLRTKAGLTQAELAEKVGVSQPTYQRWEAKNAPIPDNKLSRLALALGITAASLQERPTPVEAVLYSDKEDDPAGYWGEAAFHFRGGGEAILLTISDHAYARLYRALQDNEAFFTVRSMANQTVVFCRDALKDVYLSSEAYDSYGLEDYKYKRFRQIMIPDNREWSIIAAISDGVADEDFEPEDIERVSLRIMVLDEQFDTLIANGMMAPEDLEKNKKDARERLEIYYSLASEAVWQFSDGVRCVQDLGYDREFYEGVRDLVDFDEYSEESMVRLEIASGHRTIFINRNSLDYLSVPTHAFEAAMNAAAEEELDESA